jgi:hypothetical protein
MSICQVQSDDAPRAVPSDRLFCLPLNRRQHDLKETSAQIVMSSLDQSLFAYTGWRRETGKFEIIRKNEGNLQNFT